MTQYGIADIGSNTVVLLVYEAEGTSLKQLKYISTPAHLIDDVKDGVMSEEGIRKAADILKEYARILDDMHVSYRFADITEPCRIDNVNELINSLRESGFEIYPLTGQQEAVYTFEGAVLSWPEVSEGIAFDVGGGSTELIAFENHKAIEAMSFHLGCVRLSHLPLDTPECRKEILKAQDEYPGLKRISKKIIGIGGTARAVGLVCAKAFGNRTCIKTADLQILFEKLKNADPEMIGYMKETVEPSRIPVLLPGIHMILEICAVFEAEEILISDTGIREGFLMRRIDAL